MVRKVENTRRIKEMSMRQGGYEKGTEWKITEEIETRAADKVSEEMWTKERTE